MGPSSFLITIIWYFQVFIYVCSLNIVYPKVIINTLKQIIFKSSDTFFFFITANLEEEKRKGETDLQRNITQRGMSTNIARIKLIFNLKQNCL